MLLNSDFAQKVPVEVSLRLSGMAQEKGSIYEAQAADSSQTSPPERITGASEDSWKQRSPNSSRASLEASIDALVDVQLARLAEVPILACPQ